jgi:hypothetical protein
MKFHSVEDCLRGWYSTPCGGISRAISRLRIKRYGKSTFTCNSCPVDIISGNKNLLIHVNGKRHQSGLIKRKKSIRKSRKSKFPLNSTFNFS